MSEIIVTISELEGAAAKIEQMNETFREAAAALKTASDELGSTWEGTAHDTFVAEQEEIDKWYKMMAETVDQFVAVMKQAAADYENTDKEAAATVKG